MHLLILIDPASNLLLRLSDMLARSLPFPSSAQILPVSDVGIEEWRWADWVLLGVAYAHSNGVWENFLDSVHSKKFPSKQFAIFQIQSRCDAPLSAAYGFGLARSLREFGMCLLEKPTLFFCSSDEFSEREGEMMRAHQWLVRVTQQQLISDGKDGA